MKSPFPGMDPYLEFHWEDVHTRLIGYVADELQPQLADDLVARMEEKVYVEDDSDRLLRRPDVQIVECPSGESMRNARATTAVVDEPMLLEPIGDPIRQRSVQIVDSSSNRILTAIEILSPWNKAAGKAVDTYRKKRSQYTSSRMNLVEIDLVRTGDWTEMVGPYVLPPQAQTVYQVTVVTPESRGPFHYPISLRSKLPTFRVPLRPTDPAAVLNLQQLIEKVYAMGRYDRIDYHKPCRPPLDDSDLPWIESLLNSRT